MEPYEFIHLLLSGCLINTWIATKNLVKDLPHGWGLVYPLPQPIPGGDLASFCPEVTRKLEKKRFPVYPKACYTRL
jgi:hypothetical protein